MESIKEKYTIQITVKGVQIISTDGQEIHLTALESLMLLDILRNEEQTLKQMANASSPIPIKIKV